MITKYGPIPVALFISMLFSASVLGNEPKTTNDQQAALPQTVEEIKKYIAEAKATTDQVISLKPFRVDKHIIGYNILLTNNHYVDLFLRYGFLQDDVFTKVNGIRLTDQKNAIRALETVADTYSIEAQLIRGGEIVDISIQLK